MIAAGLLRAALAAALPLALPAALLAQGAGHLLPGWPDAHFTDVAKASGIDCTNLSGDPDKPRFVDSVGGGLCWFDYDGDGWLDLFAPNGSTLSAILGETKNPASDHLYRNRGDGTFEDVTEKAGAKDDRWSFSAVAGDYDNDGDEDVYVCNFGLNFLYRNNGDGTFTDVAESAGVQFDGVTPGAAWGDVDGDGDLDLYVTNYVQFERERPWPPFARRIRGIPVALGPIGLEGAPDKLFRNDGGGKFTDVSKEAGLRTGEQDFGLTPLIVDLDGDDLVDIFVANDMAPNHFYKQTKPGRFKPCGSDSGLLLSGQGEAQACMGIAIAALNDDLIPDLFVTNFAAQTNALYLSSGEDVWEDTPALIEKARNTLPYVKWGTGFFDFDLDGDEDLMVLDGHLYPQFENEKPHIQRYYQPSILYRRDGPLKFTDVSEQAGKDFVVERSARGAAFADYDEDGDVDVALYDIDKPLLLLRNDVEHKGHFARVQLLGTTINRDAYGSRVILEAGGEKQVRWVLGQGSFLSQNDPRALFGLGSCDKIDRITVRWTGGKEEVIEGPPGADGKPTPLAVDRTIVIKEGLGKVAELEPGKVWTRAMTAALATKPKAPSAAGGGEGGAK